MAGDLTFNKYAAAILATALGFMIIKEISHGAIHVEKQEKLAYCAECAPEETGPAVVELAFPQPDWIDAMDAAKGEKYFAACSTCHTVNKGGDNLQGPNLWNVVGRPAGSMEYGYSAGMSGMGINWGYEELDKFLTRPAKYVKGTKMGYGGEKKPAKRAALIAYLRSLSDNPLALPIAAAGADTAEGIQDIAAPVEDNQTTIIDSVKDKADGAIDKAAEMAGDVKDEAADVMENVSEGAEKAVDKAAEMAGDVKDAVKTQIDEGDDMMEEVVDKAKDLVKGSDE